ncbi:MAG: cofactor-independent phosphoglycerate mutase [Christensenellaceae bacterium]|jgi:2,3-bisphosphoglycerate-independent phosphoglycerate mutase|nr:cofactor-independent phosphoglycerate mutase [Christensenellaceae bacterium]
MKYLVVLGDGMADRPLAVLNNKTPLEAADIPDINRLAVLGQTGLIKTVPDQFKPGSDVANLSVIGYPPQIYYSGRSPLEALSIGVDMRPDDVAIRCNLVTIESDVMVDYSAGEITSSEAKEIIATISKELGSEKFKFYPGVSYRHCLIAVNAKEANNIILTPPHDITGKPICEYMPKGYMADEFSQMIKKSKHILENHPINLKRIKEGKRPATNVWLWGAGLKPNLKSFKELYGLNGTIISAVDLLKGIALGAKMQAPEVMGATGTLNTNLDNKIKAVINAFESGSDYVYLHIEAPDECGHQGDVFGKIKAIEMVNKAVKILTEYLIKTNCPYTIAILSDHATPIETKTHSREAVPYTIYKSLNPAKSGYRHTENEAKAGMYLKEGQELIKEMLGVTK